MGFKRGDFPVTEKVAAQVLSLPMFPGLALAQQRRVVEEIARFERVPVGPLAIRSAVPTYIPAPRSRPTLPRDGGEYRLPAE